MEIDRIRFGPAGNSDSFYAQGHKHSKEAPAWLSALGLDAYEYSLGRGVKIKPEKAAEIGMEAGKLDVALSVHAPYYINFASEKEEARLKSRQYLYDAAKTASAMGAARIVFHAGTCSQEIDRQDALRLAMGELEAVLSGLEEHGLDHMTLCPETMGRPRQLGTLDEVLAMCALGSRFLPCVDFGHINALGHGSLKSKGDYERVIDAIESRLGQETARRIHVHFSHIQYGEAGEMKHLTLDDDIYGPDFAPLADVFRERSMRPVVICESRDVMAEDALKLKSVYEKACCSLL